MAKKRTTYAAIVGCVLEQQRRRTGYTQSEAAELSSTSQSAWSKLNGAGYNTSVPVLRRMASAVMLSMGDVFTRADFIANMLEARGFVVHEDVTDDDVGLITGETLAGVIMAIERV